MVRQRLIVAIVADVGGVLVAAVLVRDVVLTAHHVLPGCPSSKIQIHSHHVENATRPSRDADLLHRLLIQVDSPLVERSTLASFDLAVPGSVEKRKSHQ